jgi:hypothetical protein
MRKLLIVLLVLLVSCATKYMYIQYSDECNIRYTWCDEVIETDGEFYMIKKYYNKTITNKLFWYKVITTKDYKDYIKE